MNLSAFPFFDSLEQMKGACKVGATLKCPRTRFLPFQIVKPRDSQPIDCINVHRANGQLYRTILGNEVTYTYHQTPTVDFITYYGATLSEPLACGDYYLEIGGRYSAIFSVVNSLEGLLTLEWRNEDNLYDADRKPVALYATGYLQRVHLEAEVQSPTYPYEETGAETEFKEFVADFKRVTKQSQFTTVLLPPYLADALGALPIHSQVKVGEHERVQGIEVSPEWLNFGTAASLTVTFSEQSPVLWMGCDTLELETYDVASYTPRAFLCGVTDTNPAWVNTGTVTCEQSGGNNTGYTLVEQEDINPDSATYGQKRTVKGALDESACPIPVTYYSQEQSEFVHRNNCPSGYEGSTVLVKVPAGAYTSTVSQLDANNKALAYLNATKQDYANQNGTCELDMGLPFAGNISSGTFTQSQACFLVSINSAYTETGTLQVGDRVYLDSKGEAVADPEKYYHINDDYVIKLDIGSMVESISECGGIQK